jgi:AcrR family transcriptional regulator
MEAKSTTPESRSRDGRSLRERHAEQTREVILKALAEQLAKDGFSDFDIPSLARRAGVSVRTVYRHFHSRDALLEGLADWVNSQITPFPRPASVDDLAELPEALFAAFDEHETILRAQSATDQGRALRAEGRRQHLRMYEEVLSGVTAELPPEEARAAVAVITYLLSSLAWRTMREEFGLGGADSGKAVAWAVGVLLADLRRRAASQPTTGPAAGEPASAPGHQTPEKGELP